MSIISVHGCTKLEMTRKARIDDLEKVICSSSIGKPMEIMLKVMQLWTPPLARLSIAYPHYTGISHLQ